MTVKPAFADTYLAKLSADKRATLEWVRKAIRAAAPGAVEGMSYGVPAFIQGKPIAGYAAGKNHCAYYPMSGAVVAALKDELEGYETSKGAIRFPVGKPLPATLIRKLVEARLAEIAGGPTKKRRLPKSAGKSAMRGDASVDAFLRDLDHPLKADIAAVRALILSASPAIREGIKWNAPSFRAADDFATFHLRPKDRVQLVFHTGVRPKTTRQMKLDAPADMVKWLAKDRCMVTVGAGGTIAARRDVIQGLVRQWVKQL